MSEQNPSTSAAPIAAAQAAPIASPTAATKTEGSAFQIEKIYLKDALFEQPNSPRIFLNQDKPTISVNINTASEKINDETYEVTVKGIIKGVIGDQVLFLAEVEQAGLFEIKNFPAEQMAPALEVTCPTMIYPALRYNLADMMSRAGFQPINLTEISFRAIYEQRLADAKKKTEAEAAAPAAPTVKPAAPATPAPIPTAEAAIKAATPTPQEAVEVVVEDGKVVVKPAA